MGLLVTISNEKIKPDVDAITKDSILEEDLKALLDKDNISYAIQIYFKWGSNQCSSYWIDSKKQDDPVMLFDNEIREFNSIEEVNTFIKDNYEKLSVFYELKVFYCKKDKLKLSPIQCYNMIRIMEFSNYSILNKNEDKNETSYLIQNYDAKKYVVSEIKKKLDLYENAIESEQFLKYATFCLSCLNLSKDVTSIFKSQPTEKDLFVAREQVLCVLSKLDKWVGESFSKMTSC